MDKNTLIKELEKLKKAYYTKTGSPKLMTNPDATIIGIDVVIEFIRAKY